ncbi:MAG: hypothetical protein AAF153_02600, partial [Pseudomonadota bacterium]
VDEEQGQLDVEIAANTVVKVVAGTITKVEVEVEAEAKADNKIAKAKNVKKKPTKKTKDAA